MPDDEALRSVDLHNGLLSRGRKEAVRAECHVPKDDNLRRVSHDSAKRRKTHVRPFDIRSELEANWVTL